MSTLEWDAACYYLGHALTVAGELEAAEEMLSLASRSGSARVRANALNALGAIRFYRNDLVGAEQLYREAIEAAAAADCVVVMPVPQANIGEVLVAQGRYDEAESVLLAAEPKIRQMIRTDLHFVYECLYRVYQGRGESDLANSHLEQAIQAAGDIGNTVAQRRLRTLR
jgi:tetratricopeptide (TPR) repeat protein